MLEINPQEEIKGVRELIKHNGIIHNPIGENGRKH
jgi:hypothetical protein